MPDPGTEPPSRPVIFISHRHEDRAVAQRLQQSLRRLLGDAVTVFNTSDADATGVPAGQPIRSEVRRVLAQARLVILLYTTDEGDWRWPFYECGVAMDPTDETPTKTVVFDFQTAGGSRIFEGDKRLIVDESLVQDGAAPDDFRSFIRDLAVSDIYIAAGSGADTPSSDALFRLADELYLDLLEVAPANQQKLAHELLDVLTTVPPADRRRHFRPLFADAARALQWGLTGTTARRSLFIEYWNERLLEELKSLADRRLVFRPGRVYVEWANLVELCFDTYQDDPRANIERLGRPILTLVSHEAGRLTGDGAAPPLEFWRRAEQRGQDPWFYEEPVRHVARRLGDALGPTAVEPAVERMLVVDRQWVSGPFPDDLAAVVTWMTNGGLTVSITFEDRLSDADLKLADFGIVGDIAVTRFEPAAQKPWAAADDQAERKFDPTSYRSLVVKFDPADVRAAGEAWQRLRGRVAWRSDGPRTYSSAEILAGW